MPTLIIRSNVLLSLARQIRGNLQVVRHCRRMALWCVLGTTSACFSWFPSSRPMLPQRGLHVLMGASLGGLGVLSMAVLHMNARRGRLLGRLKVCEIVILLAPMRCRTRRKLTAWRDKHTILDTRCIWHFDRALFRWVVFEWPGSRPIR